MSTNHIRWFRRVHKNIHIPLCAAVIRPQSYRLTKMYQRLFSFPKHTKCDTKVVLHVGIQRVDGDRSAKVKNRLTELMPRPENHTQRTVSFSEVWVESDGTSKV